MKLFETLVLNADMQAVKMLPVSTTTWENAIKAVYGETASVVHEYEDWEVHSPSVTIRVPSVIMIRDYVYFDKHVPWNEDYLWLRDRFTCQYCLKKFSSQLLTQDHVIPRKHGGRTSWDNIVAACGPCNHARGCNVKIQPKSQPYKPSYWELVDRAKELPLVIPDESWVPYLDWPQENLLIRGKHRTVVPLNKAA